MNTNRGLVRLTSRYGKPKRPSEIPQSGKDPETVHSEEPEITPGKEKTDSDEPPAPGELTANRQQ